MLSAKNACNRVRIGLLSACSLFLSGCAQLNIDSNEMAWASCAGGSTLLATVISTSSYGNPAAGVILGASNGGIACFFIYENDGFDTGLKSFPDRNNKEKQDQIASREQVGESSGDTSGSSSSDSFVPAMPFIPAMPVIEENESIASDDLGEQEAEPEMVVASYDPSIVELESEANRIDFESDIGSDENPLRILFEGKGLEISTQGQDYLLQLAAWLAANPELELFAVGHSDDEGSVSFALQLSLQRAEEVLNNLVELGLDDNRVILDYRGSEVPADSSESVTDQNVNRRVDITWR